MFLGAFSCSRTLCSVLGLSPFLSSRQLTWSVFLWRPVLLAWGSQEKFCTDACVGRFLKARGDRVKKAAKHLRACLSWRDAIGVGSFLPPLYPELRPPLSASFISSCFPSPILPIRPFPETRQRTTASSVRDHLSFQIFILKNFIFSFGFPFLSFLHLCIM